jgi:cardiolipin synthase
MDPAELHRIASYLIAAVVLVLALIASGHAVLYKRDSRAAVLWLGFIWLMPLAGAILYFILGINRIQRRAALLRGTMERYQTAPHAIPCPPDELEHHLPPHGRHLNGLAEAVEKVVQRPLVPGNRAELLVNGDQAYPAMLEAIAGAKQSVTLTTYIFDRDEAGLAFVRELETAVKRGVEVRVLIDATGSHYSWPPVGGALKHAKVPYARFLPTFPVWQLFSVNLRNHRKILVVDGKIGFTGGMNLRSGHRLEKNPRHPVQDIQFRLEGPVVAQLQEVFADDWLFTTGELLRGEKWFPPIESTGPIFARGIADGPDEDFDKLRWVLLSALASARESIRVVTPYFLPDRSLISALNVAALRGVTVDILLPGKNNLPFVHWASRSYWWQVLEYGCRLWLAPPPFDHSKLLVVDDCWSLIGSANWDPRSLRLNFEFNVECYDAGLAEQLARWFDSKRDQARRISLEEVDRRPLPLRLRDGVARLLTPFL